jgi:8-hydroxy-5-deazaflavin:NADPH oxidoreductase
MRIAVIGTGIVGRTLAQAFAEQGHEVAVGTRDPAETGRREEWADVDVELKSLGTVAADADLVVNATSGSASLDALGRVGAGHLSGKVLIDVSNPLDFSGGFPPTLTVKDTDSVAEQIQRTYPEARVVKALNTVTASVMVDPGSVGDPDTSVFVAGDDAGARGEVRQLLESFGWRDVIELDGLQNARGLEMWISLWVRLMGTLGTPVFNIKVVRPPAS